MSAIRILKRGLPPAKPLLFFPILVQGRFGLAVKILSEPSWLLTETYSLTALVGLRIGKEFLKPPNLFIYLRGLLRD